MSSDFLSPSRMEEEDRRRRDRIHQKLTDERGGKSVTAPVPDFLRHEDTEESRRKWDLIRQDTVNRDGAGPDAQAEALKTARDNDAPVESVLENPDLYGSAGGFSEAQAGRIAKDRPVTARTMARPDTGPAVADDGETLSFFERAYQHLGTKWTKGTDTVELKRLGVRAMAAAMEGSPMSPEMRKQVAELEGRIGAPEGENPFVGAVPDWAVRSAQTFLFVSSWGLLDFGGREMTDLVAEAPSVVTEMLPMTLHNMANSWDEVLKGGLVGTAVGAAGGPLAPVTMPVAVAGGLSAGMTTGIILETARSEGALAYFEYLKMTDSSGDLIGRDAALGGALIVGGLSGLLEVVAFGKLADTIPGLKTLRAMGRDEVRQTIARNPAVREVLARFGKQVALTGMSESAVEAMQQATQLIVADVGLGQDYTAGQYAEQLAHAARAGLQGGAGMGAGFSAPATAVEVTKAAVAGRQRKAQANAEAMRQVMARAKESKVLRRASDIFRQHIGDLEAEYGEVEVTASPEVVRTLFQDADPETLAKAPETLRNLAEAEETGGEVAIPMGELVEIAARQEIEAAIPDLRVNGELTEREAEVAVAETEASAEQMQADAEVAQDRTARLEQATAQVAENVLEQLSEAEQLSSRSAPMATMLAEGIVTQADRAGIDPVEFYESLGLEIRQSDIAELQAEDQAVEAAEVAQQQVLGTKAELDELKAQSFEAREAAQDVTGEEQQTLFDRHEALKAEVEAADGRYLEAIKARDAAAAEVGQRPAVTRLLEQSAVPIQRRPLRIVGTGPNGRVTNWDLGAALDARHQERYGRTLDPSDPADFATIVRDLGIEYRNQMQEQDSGAGWYVEDITEAIETTKLIIPELADPQNRELFLTIAALLSPQQKPLQNWENAILAMQGFLATSGTAGNFAPGDIALRKPSGKQFGVVSHTTGLQLLQGLIDEVGVAGALEWLRRSHTGRELAERRRDSGLFVAKDTLSKDLPAETVLNGTYRGIAMMGPKVSEFMLNATGIDPDAVTVDLWLFRTYNRLIGRLTDVSPAARAAGEVQSQTRTKTERAHIKTLVREAARRAGISASAMQAALWFFEQRLYARHGIATQSQNFSGAARGAAEARSIALPGGGEAVRRTGEAGTADAGGEQRGDRGEDRRGAAATPIREDAAQALEGLPPNSSGPVSFARRALEAWSEATGRPHSFQTAYVPVDVGRATRIAEAYEAMEHAPNDPAVQASYAALIEETMEMYQAVKAAGIVVEVIEPGMPDPYPGGPRQSREDLETGHWWLYPTDAGFGQEGVDVSDHPMMVPTGEFIGDRELLANDVFRIVHDVFGHGIEGVGFGPRGEENAWQAHVRMYSEAAAPAMTSETRGQNSWVNYGPHGEANQATPRETVYADQKAGLLPDFAVTEGRDEEGASNVYFQEDTPPGGVGAGRGGHRAGAQGSEDAGADRLTTPPIEAGNTVRLTHVSHANDITSVDPGFFGRNLATRTERTRKLVSGADWVQRSFYGIATGLKGGYRVEGGLGGYRYEVSIPIDRLYDIVADDQGFKEQASEAFPDDFERRVSRRERLIKDAGFAGYWVSDSELGLVALVFETLPVKRVLKQQTGKGPRGFIELGDKIRVTLTGKANASTFLHESGHLYLEILERMAEVGSDQQRADLQTIRDWVGAAPGEAFTTKQHEQFARGFEAYLREGKAPSRALAEAFSRFKTWLLTVYSSISKLDVELTDDVRGVMDRLLATDAAIAEQAQEMTPDPGLVEELGPEYRDSWLAALRAAQEAIDREAIAELKRQETEEEKATRQRIREVVVADVDARRAIRARYTMMRGELPDGTPAPPGIDKLSTEAVRGYGPKYTKRHAFLLSKDGAHPDTVAEFFGYENGQEMLDDIATTAPRKEIIAAEVEAQMKAEYGDIMERIEEAAAEATHVDETAHYLDLELRALRRQAPTKGRKAPSRVIREQARNKVRSMELWRLKPASYLAAERRARRLATEALVAGDRDAAAHHKAQELMAHHMYRETVRVREEGEKARKRLSRYTRPKVRANIGKAGEDYLDAIDELLDRVELRPVSGTEIQRRIDLGTFVARKKDEGEPIEIPEHLLLATEQRNWKQMNIDELIELREAADNIAHVARRKNDLVYRKERRDLNKTVREIETTSEKYLTRTVRDRFYTPTLIGEASEFLEWASAGMVKIEFLAELLDGKVAGLAHEIIFQPLADAQAAAFTMLKKLKKDVFNPFRRMPREQRVRWSQKHQFMGQSLQGAQIISVALNVGNEGNLEKLVAGYADIGWTRDGVLDALDKWMTKADWDLVQHVWDSLETLRDPLFDVTRKLTGVRPPAIEAVAIETRHGTYRGGYFPVAYDPRQSHLAFQHQEKKALGHFENNFMAPAVRSTATKTRTNYSAPILLNLDVIGRHLVEQVQFITHAEAVYQVNKVIRHEGFRKLVTETLGARYYQALNPWLQNVAMGGRPSSMEERTWMSSAAGYVRQGTSMAYLGLNMRTGALQILGLATALVSLPPHWIAYGMTQALNPLGWAKYLENSPEAKQMFVQSDREIREALGKETGLRGAGLPRRGLGATVGALKYVAFSPIIILQAYVNAAVWHGAYAQALRRGDGIERSKNYAQAQVRMTQSGAGPKDLAAIQRGNEGMKLFFMFNTFFSVLYNRFFIALKKHGSIKGSPILAAELATLAVVPTLLIMAATELVSDEDDEYDDQPGWAMASMLYAASTIPFLRDILAGAFGQYGYTPTPVAGTLRDLAGAGAAVGDAVMEDKELTDKDLEKIFDSLGLVFKLPARGARKGAQFLFGED